jgi:hypothetical protein
MDRAIIEEVQYRIIAAGGHDAQWHHCYKPPYCETCNITVRPATAIFMSINHEACLPDFVRIIPSADTFLQKRRLVKVCGLKRSTDDCVICWHKNPFRTLWIYGCCDDCIRGCKKDEDDMIAKIALIGHMRLLPEIARPIMLMLIGA